MVELRDRDRRREPRSAAVVAHVDPTVVGDDHPPRILRIDPDVVIVAVVQAANDLKRLAAVDALEHRHLRTPDDVRVGRIYCEGRVIPGALTQRAVIVDALPRFAAVIRAEQSALGRLDERVDALAV